METHLPFWGTKPLGHDLLQSPSKRRGKPAHEPQSTTERIRYETEIKSISFLSIGPITRVNVSSIAEEIDIGAAAEVSKEFMPTM